ncbi:MAG: tRNA uridine-5-carboxymethylaminomethyl(34) synthesis GTPase MnmE [Ruminococcaceae bacterium]|nr:tRNA uridine-5-carboxymethylaminomethyl(34) synthesis GTPase MnmE [Oscillospiraceae bacterium]
MSDIFTSTVAALSTARGKAGIAVIRVTGPDCFDIVSKVFVPRSKKALRDYPTHTAVYGDMLYEGDVVDSGLCTVFFAPNSYTGEDTAELSCHGNDLCVSLILSSLYAAGAVPAGAGEFTRRAFTNGRISLSQAEAVAELIDAQSTAALRLSNAKVSGKLSREMDDISNSLTNILASVYAFIDYPDEDLADMSKEEMKEALTVAKERLCRLCKSYNSGRAISCGINTAIVGLPNSGKSSLLNTLTDSDRAIVTDIAGTTRDVITEKVTLGNITLNLSDTAGIRQTDDAVEKIGVERAYGAVRESELVLAVIDGAAPLCKEEKDILSFLSEQKDKNVILVVNKNDIAPVSAEKAEYLESVSQGFFAIVSISAKSGDGKDQLSEKINELYPAGDDLLSAGLVITGARIYAAVNGAYNAVCEGLCTLEGYTQDLAGTDIERAISCLSEADGRKVTEEIVDNIFSRFCVGK